MELKKLAVHVATNTTKRANKAGVEKTFRSVLLRQSFREAGKVKHLTLANLASLPDHAVETLRASLKGQQWVDPTQAWVITRSLLHGHIRAVESVAAGIGFQRLLGKPSRHRDIIMALLVARICAPSSKLATLSWLADTSLNDRLGNVTTDEVYAAMDWLGDQQPTIEKKLARDHLNNPANPVKMALCDLSSSWVTGTKNPLAAYGYSRDNKRGHQQIEYGMLATPEGLPIAVRVVPGNTADPTAFIAMADEIQALAGVDDLVMVGDRGMITSARITALNEADSGLGWVSALKNLQIQKLAEDQGPLQMSLFDNQDLAEISHPNYPGERLIACRNPALAEHRAAKREDLLAATEAKLAEITTHSRGKKPYTAAQIGVKVGKILGAHKMGKHFILDIADGHFTYRRDDTNIAKEANLDGVYVIRTSVTIDTMTASEAVQAYKNLANLEKIFKTLKSRDLGIRPIYHHTEHRVRAHVLLCMLAGHLTWHLRHALAPLTFTDEHPPHRDNPVAAAVRSEAAKTKAQAHGHEVTSYQTLLAHLGTQTLNTAKIHDTDATFQLEAMPTPRQHQAHQLIDQYVKTYER